MFGQEALKYLDYVECYPDGYRKGVPIAKACEGVKIEGFPTWVINGEVCLLSEIERHGPHHELENVLAFAVCRSLQENWSYQNWHRDLALILSM